MRTLRRAVAVGLAAILLPAFAGPAAVVAATPVAAGGTQVATATDDRVEELARRLEAARIEHGIPGMAIAVVADGEPILLRGFGRTSVADDGRPVDEETVFAIGSSTKAMAGAVATMLAEEGALSFDDPVRNHVPGFRLYDEDADARVNVRDLFVHDLGVMRTDLLWYGGGATWEQILDAFARAEPGGAFRGSFNYQNVAYAAAGRACAAAAGAASWDALMRERLFAPLGMADTGTEVGMLSASSASRGHHRADDDRPYETVPPRDLAVIGAAGAVNSHARDMGRWLAFLLDRGVARDGTRLLSEDAVESLWIGRNEIQPGVGYGMGWMLREFDGRRLVEHGGNIDGFATAVALLPDEGLGFALMANVSSSPLQASCIPLVFETLLEAGDAEGEAAPSAEDPTPMLGAYAAPFLGEGVEVTALVRDGALAVDVPGQMVFGLAPPDEAGRRAFRGFPITVEFVRRDGSVVGSADDAGPAEGDAGDVVLMQLRQSGMTFELPRDGWVPAPEIPLGTLAPRLGRYRLDPPGLTLTVQVQRNRLAVDVPGEMIYELRPPDAEGWWDFRVTELIRLRFLDADGEVIVGRPAEGETPAASITLDSRGNLATFPRTADDRPLPTGAEVLERIRAAHGAAAYAEVMRTAGRLELQGRLRMVNQGLEGAIRVTATEDGRLVDAADFGPFGTITQAFEKDAGTGGGSLVTVEALPLHAVVAGRMSSPLGPASTWAHDVARVEVLGRVSGRGDDAEADAVDRLELRLVLRDDVADDLPDATAIVDEATGRVLEVSIEAPVAGAGRIRTTRRFSDHRPVLGVLVPFRITDRSPILGRVETTITSVNARAEAGGA